MTSGHFIFSLSLSFDSEYTLQIYCNSGQSICVKSNTNGKLAVVDSDIVGLL